MKTKKQKIIDVAKTEIGKRFLKMLNSDSLAISDDDVEKILVDNNLAKEYIDYENGANNGFDKKMDSLCETYVRKKQKIIIETFIKEEYNRILDDFNDKKIDKKEMNYQMMIVTTIEKTQINEK